MVQRLDCPLANCSRGKDTELGSGWKTEMNLESMDQKLKSLEIHMQVHRMEDVAPNPSNQNRIPKSEPPKVDIGISNQEWVYFLGDWKRHVEYCGMVQEKDLKHNL